MKRLFVLICILIIIIGIIYLYWSNTSIQTTLIEIEDNQLHNFTVVHISDLHNTEFGENQKTLIERVAELSPDIIAVTGDLIDSYQPDVDVSMNFITQAVKIAPVYFVPGNHEARIPKQYEEAKHIMLESGVTVLENESAEFIYENKIINIIGISDPSFSAHENKKDEELIAEKLNILTNESQRYTLLLSHRPDLIEVYSDANIDLVLSGHAHGGQVRLPFYKRYNCSKSRLFS